MITLRAKMRFYISVTIYGHTALGRNVRFFPRFDVSTDCALSRTPDPCFIALCGNLLPCGLGARVIGHIKNGEATISQFPSGRAK